MNLTKSFQARRGARRLVIDVPAFSLATGEHAALQGVSGAGKTTLLHLMAGILAVDRGSIRVAGTDICALGESKRDRFRASYVGLVFQSFHLLQGHSALENVLMAMRLAGSVDPERARHLLDRVGLCNHTDNRPRELSIGQQQRVALARALANKPRLILADEPTGNLDRARADEAVALLRDTCSECGASVLVVSHDEKVLRGFDRVEQLSLINRAATQIAVNAA